MATATLKQVDGSIMLPLTPDVLSALSLHENSSVEVAVRGCQLIVQAQASTKQQRVPRYKLADLLAEYDQMPRSAEEDREWLNNPPVGRELL